MIVYQATNIITNDSYIGITINSLQQRKRRHISDSKLKPKQHFHLAIKKYGEDNFIWEILNSSATTIDELNQLEVDYIDKLKPKYNKDKGGKGVVGLIPWNKGKTIPQELKDKISKTLTGKKISKESMTNHVMFKPGHKQSEETKRKISLAHKGRIHSEQSRKNMSEGRKKKIMTHP